MASGETQGIPNEKFFRVASPFNVEYGFRLLQKERIKAEEHVVFDNTEEEVDTALLESVSDIGDHVGFT